MSRTQSRVARLNRYEDAIAQGRQIIATRGLSPDLEKEVRAEISICLDFLGREEAAAGDDPRLAPLCRNRQPSDAAGRPAAPRFPKGRPIRIAPQDDEFSSRKWNSAAEARAPVETHKFWRLVGVRDHTQDEEAAREHSGSMSCR